MIALGRLLLLGVLGILAYAIWLRRKPDPREPPAVESKIPIVGHLIGMLRHGVAYSNIQAQKHPQYPIFSLDMIFSKMYVITSPALLQAVQRHAKALTFDPLLNGFASRIAGIRGETLKLMDEPRYDGLSLNQVVIHAMQPTLIGEPLDRMNERMARLLRPLIDELANRETVDLYEWCFYTLMAASTDASYGPLNPYKDSKVQKAFLDFESNLGPLIPNVLPWLTARKAWRGRETLVAAIKNYYEHGGQENGSELTYVRWKRTHDSGISTENIARAEAAMSIGLLSNTIPASFWILYDLYSRPALLEEIREEIKQNALRITEGNVYVIDLSAIRDNCPLLLSAFQEILRTRTTTAPLRYVTQDVLLADKYVLKKGGIINIPGGSIGRDKAVWGSTADEFNPRRFLVQSPNEENKNKKEPRRTGGFMTFGVSPMICPGRHFASAEILSMVVMLVLRLDLSPLDGIWKAPPKNPGAVASIMYPVKGCFHVKLAPREEYDGASWDFEVKPGKGKYNLMIG